MPHPLCTCTFVVLYTCDREFLPSVYFLPITWNGIPPPHTHTHVISRRSVCSQFKSIQSWLIVRVLLFQVLLAGEYWNQSASMEAHYTPLMAANTKNLLYATNVLLLDKHMTAAMMMISLQTARCTCDLGMPIHQALQLIVRNHHLRRRVLSPINVIHACVSILYVCVPINSIIVYTAVSLR